MKEIIQQVLELVRPQFRLDIEHGIHGIPHWSRVWRSGRELAEAEGVDSTVPCFFAFLHDSQRFDDGTDIEHGFRAAKWVQYLYDFRKLNIRASDFVLLCEAMRGHSHGKTEADPIVQVCWDSDRLDLGRCGTMPNPMYLCTAHAKKSSTIHAAYQRSISVGNHELRNT